MLEVVIVAVVVAGASVYLAWTFWRSVRPKSGGGCAACHVKRPVARSADVPWEAQLPREHRRRANDVP